jgi:hypothetical protein
MNKQLSTNRLHELRKEIDAIANMPKANSETAAKAAVALVACWPGQQAQDEMVAKAYMRRLTELLIGQDIDVLQKLLDEFVRKQKFLPAIAEVEDFIDSKMEPKRSRISWYLDEIKALEERDSVRMASPEERERQYQRAREVSRIIRETAQKKCVQNLPPAIQMPDGKAAHAARMEALANLEFINGRMDDADGLRDADDSGSVLAGTGAGNE